MTSAPSPFLAAVRRYWLLILLSGLVIGAAGSAWAAQRPAFYSASASVLVNPIQGTPFNGQTGRAGDSSLQTERLLVVSPPVLTAASSALHGRPSAAAVARGLDVQIPSSTQVLTITYTSGDRLLAPHVVQAVADAYLAARQAAGAANQKERLTALTAQQKTIQASINATARRLAVTRDAAGQTTLRTALDAYSAQLISMENQISQIHQVVINPGSVIDPPGAATRVSRLVELGMAGGALALGLLLGLGVALLRTMTDRRVRGPEDLAGELVLADVPRLDRRAAEPVSATGVGSPAEEAYRRLRIATLARSSRPGVIIVTGVGSPMSAAVAAANLAVSATHTGASVAVIDAAPECGAEGASALLGVPAGPGLAEALSDGTPVSILLQRSEFGPQVLPPGSGLGPMGTASLPATPDGLLAQLRASFDYVIVAAPGPTTPTAEALAAAGDATVLVVTTDVSSRRDVTEARRHLETLRVSVLGAVVLTRRRTQARPPIDGVPSPRAGLTAGRGAGKAAGKAAGKDAGKDGTAETAVKVTR